MANTPSAKKRVRQILRKTEVNKSRRSRIKTLIKTVEHHIVNGDSKNAIDAFKVAHPEIQRGVTKGIFHKNTASRKISRLSKRIKAVSV